MESNSIQIIPLDFLFSSMNKCINSIIILLWLSLLLFCVWVSVFVVVMYKSACGFGGKKETISLFSKYFYVWGNNGSKIAESEP